MPDDMVRTTSRLLFPVVLVFAASQILNAHRVPGEGFSAGLLVAMSILLLYVGMGYREVERRLPRAVHLALPAGLAVAILSALLGPLVGRELLSSWHADVEVIGLHLHLSTTTLFDLAIFLVIAGGTHRVLHDLGQPEEAP